MDYFCRKNDRLPGAVSVYSDAAAFEYYYDISSRTTYSKKNGKLTGR
jgi:hypothetical protein